MAKVKFYPMIGFGTGILPGDQIFVEIEFAALPPGARSAQLRRLRVKMPRDKAAEFGQAIVQTANIDRTPPDPSPVPGTRH